MKKALSFVAFVLVASLALQSCNSDSKIKQTVETTINQAYPEIKAAVDKGTVTLTGTVASQNEKTMLENAVRSIKGVKSVVNNVMVGNSQQQSMDMTIMNNVNSKLQAAGHNMVHVSVQDGVLTLSGDLNRDNLTHVMQIASESGATRVVNNLNLK